MKASILIAAISVGIMIFVRLFMGVLAFLSGGASVVAVGLPIALAVLILIGILGGQRLAWQWGRLLGLVGGTLLTLAAFGAFAQAREEPGYIIVGILLVLQGVPLFPMFFALGTRGAREHFRVICPQCGHAKPKGGDFLFTKAVCRKCNAVWQ